MNRKLFESQGVKMRDYCEAQDKGNGVVHFTCGSNPEGKLMKRVGQMVDTFNSKLSGDEAKISFVPVRKRELKNFELF